MMVKQLKAHWVTIPEQWKILYHAGGVITSNFLVALFMASVRIYQQLGISKVEALKILMPLAEKTLAHIKEHGPKDALTGPASRGDFKTIQAHRKALLQLDPELEKMYNVMTQICSNSKRSE